MGGVDGGGAGGGGGLAVTFKRFVVVLGNPVVDTRIASPDEAAVAVNPLKVAIPFWACTMVVKPGSLASEIDTPPLKVLSTLWN